MIEHSQLNTHKAAHVGHLRNICLGVAITNITEAAGYHTMPATYIGDIGRHVIQCLWCYETFHEGEEPRLRGSRGRWLGDIYAESSARLGYRKDLLGFLNRLIKEDDAFVDVDVHARLLALEGDRADRADGDAGDHDATPRDEALRVVEERIDADSGVTAAVAVDVTVDPHEEPDAQDDGDAYLCRFE